MLNIKLYNTATPLLGIYPREMKKYVYKKSTYTNIRNNIISYSKKNAKQFNCPSAEECAHSCNEMLLSNKTCYHVIDSQKY